MGFSILRSFSIVRRPKKLSIGLTPKKFRALMIPQTFINFKNFQEFCVCNMFEEAFVYVGISQYMFAIWLMSYNNSQPKTTRRISNAWVHDIRTTKAPKDAALALWLGTYIWKRLYTALICNLDHLNPGSFVTWAPRSARHLTPTLHNTCA